jgi:hypothetical protein
MNKQLAKIFSNSVGCVFTLVIVSFFNLMQSHFQFLLLLPEQLDCNSESCYLYLDLEVFSLFSSSSLKVSGLSLRSLISV